MRLVQLELEHEASLQAFLADFAEAGEKDIPAYFADPSWPHAEIVERFAAQSRGQGLEAGWVPGTTLFLIDRSWIVGVANVRHRLTDGLRRFGGHVGYSIRPSERGKGYGTRQLEAVKDYVRENLGIDRLLITCGSDNRASARVIEKCGGVLEDESFYKPAGKRVFRYWIAL